MERTVHELIFLFLAAILLLVAGVSSLKDDETKEHKTYHYRSLVTNPVTTPSIYTPNLSPPSVNIPGTMPYATPVSSGSPGGLPGSVPVAPPSTTGVPAVSGQSWCVAKSGSLEIALQSALDYACGTGGVDCSAIQQGGSCYNPNSLEFHASYAFNSYYLKNPTQQTSCDFGGTAMLTNANPSSGSCIYPTVSSSTLVPSPVTQNPITSSPTPISPTPTTSSSSGATVPGAAGPPPFVLNSSNPSSGIPGVPVSNPVTGIPGFPVSNPASGTSGIPVTSPPSGFPITDFPYSPPGASTSTSMSSSLQPLIGGFLCVTYILTWKHIFDF